MGPGAKPRSVSRCCPCLTSSPALPLPRPWVRLVLTTAGLVLTTIGAAVMTPADVTAPAAAVVCTELALVAPPWPEIPAKITTAKTPAPATTGIHRPIGGCAPAPRMRRGGGCRLTGLQCKRVQIGA